MGEKERVQFSEPQKTDFHISFSRQVSHHSTSDSTQLKCPVYVYNCSLEFLKEQLVHPNSSRQPRDIFRYWGTGWIHVWSCDYDSVLQDCHFSPFERRVKYGFNRFSIRLQGNMWIRWRTLIVFESIVKFIHLNVDECHRQIWNDICKCTCLIPACVSGRSLSQDRSNPSPWTDILAQPHKHKELANYCSLLQEHYHQSFVKGDTSPHQY